MYELIVKCQFYLKETIKHWINQFLTTNRSENDLHNNKIGNKVNKWIRTKIELN